MQNFDFPLVVVLVVVAIICIIASVRSLGDDEKFFSFFILGCGLFFLTIGSRIFLEHVSIDFSMDGILHPAIEDNIFYIIGLTCVASILASLFFWFRDLQIKKKKRNEANVGGDGPQNH